MRIALVTTTDPRDRRSWSGTIHQMLCALERHVGDVDCVGPLRSGFVPLGRAANRAARAIVRRGFDWSHSHRLARSYARSVEARLRHGNHDVIFAPAASAAIAYLDTELPIVYSSDATVALSERYYNPEPSFAFSRRSAESIETAAIRKARALVYPTDWVASSAVRDYGADPETVHVIPYGANLESPPERAEVVRRTPGPVCRLLFLGVDWHRKGGDVAVAALRALHTRGVQAELTVCGCTPRPHTGDAAIRVVPFLDKNVPRQRTELHRMLLSADFLVLPTRAEAYGIVFCEAAAYGLPVVSCATGGVPDVVEHEHTGFLLPPGASGDDYGQVIASIWEHAERYTAMAAAARDVYESRLNWDVWGRRMRGVVASLATPPQRRRRGRDDQYVENAS